MRSGGNAVRGAAERGAALDANGAGAGPVNPGAHGGEQLAQVLHLGFQGGVLQHCRPLGQAGGHHQVLGGGDGGGVEREMRALEAAAPGLDVALLYADFRAHGLKSGNVPVDRARPDGAAPRQGHLGLAETGQQRTQQEDGAAHGFHQIVGCAGGVHAGTVDGQPVPVALHPAAQQLQQLQGGVDVAHRGDVADLQGFGGQQGRRDHGQGRILGPGGGDIPPQWPAALDDQPVHQAARPGVSSPASTRPL